MKKSNKLKPILTATLLVLPSFLFLSPSQKSNARLVQTIKSGIKFRPTSNINILSNIKLNTQTIPKNIFKKNGTSTLVSSSSITNGANTKLNLPTNTDIKKITISRSSSTSSTSSRPQLTVRRANSSPTTSIQSSSQVNSIKLDGPNNAPLQERLLLHLQKNGIKPQNTVKFESSNLSWLSDSKA